MAAPLSALRRSSLYEIVAAELRRYIQESGLAPGDRLPPERILCERLAVSRGALREGLRALQVLGMVDIRHGSGIYVGAAFGSALPPLPTTMSIDRKELRDFFAVRETLELMALRLAAERIRPGEIDQLASLVERSRAAIAADESPVESDIEFHRTIFRASDNGVLCRLLEAIRAPLRGCGDTLWHQDPSHQAARQTLLRHQRVVEALRRGDSRVALAEMQHHLRESAQLTATLIP